MKPYITFFLLFLFFVPSLFAQTLPGIDHIPDVTANEDALPIIVQMTGLSDNDDSPIQQLTVSATSDNPSLVTNITVNYTSPNPTGNLGLTLGPNAHGTATITVTVSDADGNTSTSFLVTVTPVNDPPAFSSFTLDPATQDLPYTYTVEASDPENDILSFSSTTLSAWLSLTNNGDNTATLSGTPGNNDVGNYNITLQVADAEYQTLQSFAIEVQDVNDPPAFSSTPVTLATQDQLYTYTVVASDPDNDILSFSSTTLPAWLSLTNNGDNTATLSGTPGNNDVGNYNITLQVEDAEYPIVQSFAIEVQDINDPPAFSSTPVTLATQDQLYTYTVVASDPDNDILSFPSTTLPAWLSLTNNGDNTATLSGTPGNSDVGNYNITLQVADAEYQTLQSFAIEVQDINDPPAFSSTPVTLATQDQLYTYTVVTSDPENDILSFPSTTLPAWLSLTNNGDNTATLSGTPGNNDVGNYNITLQVADAEYTIVQTFTIEVQNVNDAPIAINGSYSTAENQSINISITSLVSDADNNLDFTTLQVTSTPTNGTTTVNPAAASITYTPNTGTTGIDQFTYSISDDEGAGDTGIITIQVEGQSPIAQDDNFSLNEDEVFLVNPLGNDTDPQDNIAPGTLSLTAAPEHGSISNDGAGHFIYTPEANYVGMDQVSYRICDSTDFCDEAVINLTISSVNDAPVLVSDIVTTMEDTPIDIDVLANDSDPNDSDGAINTGSIAMEQNPANGTATINLSGVITYTPDEDFNGQDSFTYSVADNGVPAPALREEATVTINVAAVNDQPTAANDYIFTVQSTGLVADPPILDNDNDHKDTNGGLDRSSLKLIQLPKHGELNILSNQNISYIPNTNFFGRDTARYVISDLGYPLPAQTDTAYIFIEVTRLSPEAVDDNITTNEDSPIIIDVLQNDIDANLDPGSLTFQTMPQNGTISKSPNGMVSYTPSPNFFGIDRFNYTITDLTGFVSNTATVTITVTAVPDAPQVLDANFSTPENTPLTISLVDLITDAENNQDYSTIQFVTTPGTGTIESAPNPANLIYRPATGYAGTVSFQYRVSDQDGLTSNTSIITIVVSDQAPRANDDEVTTSEDSAITIDILNNDTDPQDNLNPESLLMTIPPEFGAFTIDRVNGMVTYTPSANFNGEDHFTYRICDQDGYCDEARVTITVEPSNDSPVPQDDYFETNEDTPIFLDVLINDTDIDHDLSDLTLTILSDPTHGTVNNDINLHGFNYQPGTNFFGSDEFSYRLTDPDGASGTATVTIEIIPVNDAPIPVYDNYTQIGESGASLAVLNNDSDPENNIDPGTLTIDPPPNHGTTNVDPITGEIFYQPNQDFFGNDTFTYQICDTQGACATAQVSLQVIAGNTPPIAVNDTLVVMDGTSNNVIHISDNDVDEQGQSLTYALLTSSLFGTVQFETNGNLIYEANSNTYCNTDRLQYRVCDPLGACDTASLIIQIIPADLNADGIPDLLEGDSDNDNIPDRIEAGTYDLCQEIFRDTDNDGTPDYLDIDSDNDNVNDVVEGVDDCDNDGIPNYMDAFDDCGERLHIPSTFSPNGDNINDYWLIRGINAFPDNELYIYNRWGGLVYHQKGYNNTWNGQSNSNTLGSDQLPEGTYFYVLKLGNRTEKGTVFIKR